MRGTITISEMAYSSGEGDGVVGAGIRGGRMGLQKDSPHLEHVVESNRTTELHLGHKLGSVSNISPHSLHCSMSGVAEAPQEGHS